jgi:hypothetical protein
MEQATEKQVSYLNSLINTARQGIGHGIYHRFAREYQAAKYGRSTMSLEEWKAGRAERATNREADTNEMMAKIERHLNRVSTEGLSKSEASRLIDTYKSLGWLNIVFAE